MWLMCLLILVLTQSVLMQQSCGPGYTAVKRQCVDENECEFEDPVCGDHAVCTNTNGSYYCHCKEGFKPRGNFTQDQSIKCQVINECSDISVDCGPNASCYNSEGHYSCVCNTGYISSNGAETFIDGQGVQCVDINECEESSSCGINASCHNIPGGYNCTCAPGFRTKSRRTHFTDSESCESVCDIDEFICGEGSCKNGKDAHECVCKPGFTNYGDKQMKCTELKCDTFISNLSQAPQELTEIASLMTNSCLLLKSESVRKHATQVDGIKLLEAFLAALDKLLRDGFQADNRQISGLFGIVEEMLKWIGPMLNNNQTRRTANETEVELLVKRDISPPQGPFVISIDSTQFTSHWETATGNTSLGFTIAALLSYKSLDKSLNNYFAHLKTQEQKNINFKINSKVVTAVVSNNDTNHLKKPITLTFTHLKDMKNNHTCVFWDHKLDGGAWSTHGCTTVTSSDGRTVCSCTHLSSFAVLMALYDIGDVYELRLITWIGLSISLICLLICIATFYLVRSIHSTRTTIHLHLCITLFIAYFVFLVGIARTENKVGCAVVAGTLHYFFLAAFCWMCLEGVQLFRMVVLVFNTTARPVYLLAAGYGVPAVIVAVSAVVNWKGYGSTRHCWLNIEDGFIWSFYGPVCLIIIVNVFFFLITIWKLAEKFSSLNPDLNNLRKIRTFTITAIAQLCVLGIMWVFGCFQFDEGTLAVSYIFTILGSLQGVLMFIMHCWLSKQVREEYVKFLSYIRVPQKRKYTEFSSNQTSKSQTSKSVQNTGESSI